MVTAGKPGIISTRFQLTEKDELQKISGGQLVKGRVETPAVTVEEFARSARAKCMLLCTCFFGYIDDPNVFLRDLCGESPILFT